MSNLLNMDKSNGNGVYATGSCHTDNAIATTTTTTTTASTALNIMNGAAAVAAAAAAATTLPTSASSEDLSQSLSEYTDADESISAPTEFLAEFLSAVMLKDYKKALKYCKLILQYEPNNGTAKEFYPLILDKLRVAASSDSDENYNKSSSPELALDLEQHCEDSVSSHSSSHNNCSDEDNDDVDDEHDDDVDVDDDEDDVDEDDDVDVDVDDEDDDDDDDDIDVVDVEEEESSSGDDYELPIDEQQDVAAVDGLPAHTSHSHSHNDSGSSRNSSSGGGGGRSDNTTHSYSSLLLEEEDDIVPVQLQFGNKDAASATDLDISNGNKVISASCSDSESPTEPLTQRLAAILRSKCGVSARKADDKAGEDNEPY